MTLLRIASFDIGKKNFAFCIEECDRDRLLDTAFKPTPKTTLGEEYMQMVQDIHSNGTLLLLDNVDLTKGVKQPKGQAIGADVYLEMYTVLDQYRELWDTCHVFVIEQQMGFGNRRNTMALKLAQHCYSYFAMLYRGSKEIYEIPAYQKTRVFTKSKLNDSQRKKWAVTRAVEILQSRQDSKHLDLIKSRKKKDDLSDVIVQAQAYKYLYNRRIHATPLSKSSTPRSL